MKENNYSGNYNHFAAVTKEKSVDDSAIIINNNNNKHRKHEFCCVAITVIQKR